MVLVLALSFPFPQAFSGLQLPLAAERYDTPNYTIHITLTLRLKPPLWAVFLNLNTALFTLFPGLPLAVA